ncbi:MULTISPECIES: hypothetical protein [unclassified Clostridioides]|uniref:hypothetical protein n=1 Tax=unclassified Clostridioides TaxID=2635829 RepID=UPI001D0C145F|nr:hypothetical protein JJC16_08790 [Clostridioides sp. ES-S-0107-01]UDN56169.1 hypothetical protein JJC02_08445 [Clostridioides sp. ES-S-0054-01]
MFLLKYSDTINVFEKILGPELEGSLGMFTDGYWLWFIGKYVEMSGVERHLSKYTKHMLNEFFMIQINGCISNV